MSDLQAIADRFEIEALRGDFTDAVMMRDYDRLASLFTQDGVVRMPHINAEAVSREEIRAGIERLQGLWDYLVQTTHPGTIQLEGDTAVGRAYIAELGRFRDGSSHLNYAVYHDRYQRTPDGWKWRRRCAAVADGALVRQQGRARLQPPAAGRNRPRAGLRGHARSLGFARPWRGPGGGDRRPAYGGRRRGAPAHRAARHHRQARPATGPLPRVTDAADQRLSAQASARSYTLMWHRARGGPHAGAVNGRPVGRPRRGHPTLRSSRSPGRHQRPPHPEMVNSVQHTVAAS
jgi:ketosteroid isomerase-like protein